LQAFVYIISGVFRGLYPRTPAAGKGESLPYPSADAKKVGKERHLFATNSNGIKQEKQRNDTEVSS